MKVVRRKALASRSIRDRSLLALVCILAGVGIGAGLSLAFRAHAAPRGPATDGVAADSLLTRQPAPPFVLSDQNGNRVSLAAQKGHVVLLTFMDPVCTALCPLMGQDIAAVEQQLPKGLNPELLIVSVAPGRTSEDVQHFISTNLSTHWLRDWHWLLGPDEAALRLAWLHWHVSVDATPADVVHDSILSVIDPQGYLRVSFPAPLPVRDVVSAITTIAHS